MTGAVNRAGKLLVFSIGTVSTAGIKIIIRYRGIMLGFIIWMVAGVLGATAIIAVGVYTLLALTGG